MTLHTQLPIYKTGVELLLARQARRRLMTTKTKPLPPLPEPLCNLPAYCRDAINSYAGTAVREALAAQPAPAGLTDEQIATMRSDAWLVFNASEASQEVRDVIEWYDGTLRAAVAATPAKASALSNAELLEALKVAVDVIGRDAKRRVNGHEWERHAEVMRQHRAALQQEGSAK